MKYYHKRLGHELHNPTVKTIRAFESGQDGHFHYFTASGSAWFASMEDVVTEKPVNYKD